MAQNATLPASLSSKITDGLLRGELAVPRSRRDRRSGHGRDRGPLRSRRGGRARDPGRRGRGRQIHRHRRGDRCGPGRRPVGTDPARAARPLRLPDSRREGARGGARDGLEPHLPHGGQSRAPGRRRGDRAALGDAGAREPGGPPARPQVAGLPARRGRRGARARGRPEQGAEEPPREPGGDGCARLPVERRRSREGPRERLPRRRRAPRPVRPVPERQGVDRASRRREGGDREAPLIWTARRRGLLWIALRSPGAADARDVPLRLGRADRHAGRRRPRPLRRGAHHGPPPGDDSRPGPTRRGPPETARRAAAPQSLPSPGRGEGEGAG